MPELPEVETVRRSLVSRLIGLTVLGVEAAKGNRALRCVDPAWFQQKLVEKTFTRLARRGKYLICHLSEGWLLTFHLRMTGRLTYVKASQPLARHTALVFTLSDGNQLRFVDQRKFGVVYLHRSLEEVPGLAMMGPEPLAPEFSVEVLARILQDRKASIKAVLLDQRSIAGIGNIYADESLFQAKIHPTREAGSLTPTEVERLHRAIRDTLQAGIDFGGTSFRDYVDGFGRPGGFQQQLSVYGRAGEPCVRCGRPLAKSRVGGRTSVYCTYCQS